MEVGVLGAVWEVWEGERGNNGGMEEEGLGGMSDPHMVFPCRKEFQQEDCNIPSSFSKTHPATD